MRHPTLDDIRRSANRTLYIKAGELITFNLKNNLDIVNMYCFFKACTDKVSFKVIDKNKNHDDSIDITFQPNKDVWYEPLQGLESLTTLKPPNNGVNADPEKAGEGLGGERQA